jgi:outer membrane protein
MKKIILFTVMFSLAISLSAQLYVGGKVSFMTIKSDQTIDNTTTEIYRMTDFRIMPEAGYFLSNDFAIGGKVGISMDRQNTNPGGNDNIESLLRFHIGPYVRKYFPISDKIFLYGEGGFDFATGTTKNIVDGDKTDGNTVTDFSLEVKPGLEYKVSKRFALNMNIGSIDYEIHREKTPGDPETISSSKGFQFAFGLNNLNFGIKYYLNSAGSTSGSE